MEFKRILIVLSITITILMCLMMGVSYGWYAYENAQSTVSGSTIKEAPTVIFSQTEYISSTQTLPILDKDRYNYANKNSFNVTIGENLREYQVGIEISLVNISMSDELKIANYKYELLQDGITIATGNFENLDVTTIKLMPMTIVNPLGYPQTYTYELYIWLSDDGTNQNNLMNKGFNARVNINSAVKK